MSKNTRKANEPIIDKTHLSTAPITNTGPQNRKGNPVKADGHIFGMRRHMRNTRSA